MSIGRRTFLWAAVLGAVGIRATLQDAEAAALTQPARKPPGKRSRAVKPAQRPLVVIDPGHGGKDPGAIGVSGTHEKQIALAAAQLLQRRLERSGRYRVRLTRMRDVFIPLAGRVALAERHGASLFVSLHADALRHHAARGASTYIFATKASDPQSAALAMQENSADGSGADVYQDLQPDVRQILSTMIVRETRVGSATVQHAMVDALKPRLRMLPNPSRQARFAVLRSVRLPSVLIEMGFMSNRLDERLLRQPKHRMVIATAMTGAIDSYFAKAQGNGLFTG